MLPRILLLVFILTCWWIVPPSPAVPPACPSLDARGFISNSHYFVREATDVILCLNLDSSSEHRFCFPGRSIYEPQLSRRNPNWLYFLTETSGTVTPGGPYSLIGADLIDSSTRVVADLPYVFPHHTVMIEEAGIDFALIWQRGVSIWESGKEQLFETWEARRFWDLSYDAERKRLTWLTTTDQEAISAWDEHFPMRTIQVNEFDLTSGKETTVSITLPGDTSSCNLMESAEQSILLLAMTAQKPTIWESAREILFATPFDFRPGQTLIEYGRRTDEARETRSFPDPLLWSHHGRWMVVGSFLAGGSAWLTDWKTGKRTVVQGSSFRGLEVNAEGDPVVLTQDGGIIFDRESLQVKSHFKTPPSME